VYKLNTYTTYAPMLVINIIMPGMLQKYKEIQITLLCVKLPMCFGEFPLSANGQGVLLMIVH